MIKSYVSPKIRLSKSKIHGIGMFANEIIKKGEIVFIKGGHILSKDQLYFSEKITSYLPIDDDFYLGATTEEEEKSVKLYNNHSCDPNCGMRGEITFIAMRDIMEDEELTIDYAMVDNEDYKFECNCKTSNCRKIITGYDWKKLSLQNKYKGYFAVYLVEKINRLR